MSVELPSERDMTAACVANRLRFLADVLRHNRPVGQWPNDLTAVDLDAAIAALEGIADARAEAKILRGRDDYFREQREGLVRAIDFRDTELARLRAELASVTAERDALRADNMRLKERVNRLLDLIKDEAPHMAAKRIIAADNAAIDAARAAGGGGNEA